MFAVLEAARDALALVPGVASCRIGLEQGITAADYPLIRLVPSRITPGRPYNNRTAECLVYFGMDTTAAEAGGLEAVYAALFGLEAEIIELNGAAINQKLLTRSKVCCRTLRRI